MKNQFISQITIFFIMIFISITLIGCENPSLFSAKNSIHIRQGYFGDQPAEYKFRDVSSDIDCITEFLWDKIRKNISEDIFDRIVIEYWIYTSVLNAELAMVEQLEMSNLVMKNTIDFPLSGGEIANNCWEALKYGAIGFIRNNVLIFVLDNGTQSINADEIESTARVVDEALKNTVKVSDCNLVPVPKINSVEIISPLPKTWNDTVTIKLDATDPDKLFYRKLAAPLGSISETGVLTVKVIKSVDQTADPQKAKIKIWIWNENYFVHLLEKEIPFGK